MPPRAVCGTRSERRVGVGGAAARGEGRYLHGCLLPREQGRPLLLGHRVPHFRLLALRKHLERHVRLPLRLVQHRHIPPQRLYTHLESCARRAQQLMHRILRVRRRHAVPKPLEQREQPSVEPTTPVFQVRNHLAGSDLFKRRKLMRLRRPPPTSLHAHRRRAALPLDVCHGEGCWSAVVECAGEEGARPSAVLDGLARLRLCLVLHVNGEDPWTPVELDRHDVAAGGKDVTDLLRRVIRPCWAYL